MVAQRGTPAAEMMTVSTVNGFGLTLHAEFALPFASQLRRDGDHVVTARIAETGDPLLTMAAPTPALWSATFGDHTRVVATRLDDGGYRIDYGDAARFLLLPGWESVLVDPREPDEPGWRRFLLDTVLWWLALLHGRHLVHAAVVALDRGELVAIVGPSGAGKTTLASALVLRGGRLFSDDILCLDDAGVAQPGPPLMNLPSADGRARRLGVVLAEFPDEGELWVRPARAATTPGRISALCFLKRREGHRLCARPRPLTPLDLFPHVWAIPGDADPTGARFCTLADLAQSVAAYDLEAGFTDSVEDLAAVVEGLPARAAGG